MTALVISVVLISWITSAIVRKADKKRRAEEIARISAEIRQQKAEQKKQATEQARQAKELEKHEAMLLKHEEEIRKLNHIVLESKYTMKTAQQSIENLTDMYDIAVKELEAANHAGDDKRKMKALRTVNSLNNQINAQVKKRESARAKIENAERKLKEVA